MERILLGLLYVGLTVAFLLLVGAAARWLLKLIAGIDIDATVVKMYLIIVALVALYQLVALAFGLPYAIMRPLS